MTRLNRRDFVRRSAGAGAAVGLGAAVAAQAASPIAAPAQTQVKSPNDEVVLSLVGAGGRGTMLAKLFAALPNVRIKSICDAEDARAAAAAKAVEQVQHSAPKPVRDMRAALDDKEVHAVIVATPEQWHALATVWACQAGKDVYVEKCISRRILEGRRMIEAARKYKRIVMCGTQSRTSPYAQSAREYVAAGKLGAVQLVKVFFMLPNYVYGGYPIKPEPPSQQPPGLDWDAWLGPAPEKPYTRHRHRQWYGYWDYSGGNFSDGIHSVDLARMVLGDPPHPKAVSCVGGRWQYQDGGEMPDTQIVTYEFDKMAMTAEVTGFSPYFVKEDPDHRRGLKFTEWRQLGTRIEIYGTKALMCISRHGGGWQVFVEGGKVEAEEHGQFADQYAVPNFVESIRTRKTSKADIEPGHHSATLEHLAQLAYQLGNQRLVFDGRTETFPGNEAANRLAQPAGRKQYRMPDTV